MTSEIKANEMDTKPLIGKGDDIDIVQKKDEPNMKEGNKRKVRMMPNGHWSIPFSCAWVMKRIE